MSEAGAFSLRSVEAADAELLLRWRNAESNRPFMYNTAPIELATHLRWLAAELANPQSRHLIFQQGDEAIGYASLTDITVQHRRCSWGFNLAETPQPKGSGARMLFYVADYAFTELGLEKICSEVLSFNSASLRVHQRLGFASEGRRRRHIHRDDGVFDIELFALFADAWQTQRQALLSELLDG